MAFDLPSDNQNGYDVSRRQELVSKAIKTSTKCDVIDLDYSIIIHHLKLCNCVGLAFQNTDIMSVASQFAGKDYLIAHGTHDGTATVSF